MTCQWIQRKQKHLYPSLELMTRTRMHAENHQRGTSVFRPAFCQRPGSVFRGLTSRLSQLSTQTYGTGLGYHVLGKQSKAVVHEFRYQTTAVLQIHRKKQHQNMSPWRSSELLCSFQRKQTAVQVPSLCPRCSSPFNGPLCSKFLPAAATSSF